MKVAPQSQTSRVRVRNRDVGRRGSSLQRSAFLSATFTFALAASAAAALGWARPASVEFNRGSS
jgi:hypothetical protein